MPAADGALFVNRARKNPEQADEMKCLYKAKRGQPALSLYCTPGRRGGVRSGRSDRRPIRMQNE